MLQNQRRSAYNGASMTWSLLPKTGSRWRPISQPPASPSREVRRWAFNGSKREWALLPETGATWRAISAGGDQTEGAEAYDGQVVRVEYTVRLDDGSHVASATSSFRTGSQSTGVCACIEEVVRGMRLGDTRRVRAPPSARRGPRLHRAPSTGALEYDVTLTGMVHNLQILVVEESPRSSQPRPSEDPIRAFVTMMLGKQAGQRHSIMALAAEAGLPDAQHRVLAQDGGKAKGQDGGS